MAASGNWPIRFQLVGLLLDLYLPSQENRGLGFTAYVTHDGLCFTADGTSSLGCTRFPVSADISLRRFPSPRSRAAVGGRPEFARDFFENLSESPLAHAVADTSLSVRWGELQ